MQIAKEAPRDNSLIFVRLVLAVMVIFGHCFPLGGEFGSEPLWSLCKGQLTSDGLAVKGFFVLSGYLLMQTVANHPSLMRYVIRRTFRIMPAFWVCLLVTALLVVPAMMKLMILAPISYWESITLGGQNAVTYVTENAALYLQQWDVYPVFHYNKVPDALNGSLWTMPFEGLCYVALGFAAAFRVLRCRAAVITAFALFYVPWVIFAWRPFPVFSGFGLWTPILNTGVHPRGQGVMLAFIAGVITYSVTEGKLKWNTKHFVIAMACLITSMLVGGYALVWPLVLPYIVIALSYKLPFHSFGRLGDFSYGTYLYAFLIQQCLYAFGVQRSGFIAFFGLAVLLSIACGALSWMLVERPAIKLGAHLIKFASNPVRQVPEAIEQTLAPSPS